MLKNQLKSYKKIIAQRSSSALPVVTYQDNIQEKMWDFTVRGWRVANITGMESNFDEVESLKSQREVKKLKYEDTKIGKFCLLGYLTEGIKFTSECVW